MSKLKLVILTVISTLLAVGIASLIFLIVILNNRPVINNDSSFISSSDVTSSLSIESSEDDSIYQNIDNKIKNNLKQYSLLVDEKDIEDIIYLFKNNNDLYIVTKLINNELRTFIFNYENDINYFLNNLDFIHLEFLEIKTFNINNDDINNIDIFINKYQSTFKGYSVTLTSTIKSAYGIYQNNDSYLLIYDIRYEDDFIENQSSFSININSKDIYYSYISFISKK